MSRRRLRADLLAIALLVVVVTLPFLDILFAGNRFYVRDLTRYYYPTKQILRNIVLGGEFPYWNRFYSAGQPIAANPEYEVFYPLQWLILLPNYDLGYRLHILIHVPIAAIGMYLLLRSLRLRIAAAFFGGMVFAIGGVFVSLINLLPILFCIVWIPYVLLFARRFLIRPNVRDFALASLFLGIEGLVGEPTSLVQTWLLIGAYAAWRALRAARPVRELARNAMLSGLIVVAGFLGGAVQLITAADHVGDSVRSRPFELSLITTWSMPFARPIELVFPNFFGHLFGVAGSYWGSGLYPRTASPFMFSIYLGLLAAAMIVAAFASRSRGVAIVGALAAFSSLLALGGNTPLFRWLDDLGLTGPVRYPEKFAFIALFALNILAAIGFDRFLRRDRVVRQLAIGFAAATAVVALIFAMLSFTPLYRDFLASVWGVSDATRLATALGLSRQDWALALIRGAALTALLWAGASRRGAAWHAAAIAFVLLDLAPIGVDVLPRTSAKFFTAPPVSKEIARPAEPFRIFHEADWYGGSEMSNKYFGVGRDVYWVVRNGMFPMTTAKWGFETVLERDYDKTALLPTVDLVDAMWRVREAGRKDWREVFGSMSNVAYIGQYRPFEAERGRIGGNFKVARPVDFHKRSLMPRYRFADRLVQVGGEDDFVRRIVRGEWSRDGAFVNFTPFTPSAGRVLETRETANTTTLAVECEGTGYLVMSVTYHRYWSATIDGRSAKIEPTNLAYQGLVIPPGKHRVELRYRNPLVLPAGVVSATVLFGSLVCGVVAPSRKRDRVESRP